MIFTFNDSDKLILFCENYNNCQLIKSDTTNFVVSFIACDQPAHWRYIELSARCQYMELSAR